MRKNVPDEYFRTLLNASGRFFILFICCTALLWMMREYFYFVLNCFVTDSEYIGSLNYFQKSLTFAGLGIYPLLSYFLLSYIKGISGYKRVSKTISSSAGSSLLIKGMK